MHKSRTPLLRLPMPRRGRGDRRWRPLDRPYETVEEDFDDVRIDDLCRQADGGAIDVADL